MMKKANERPPAKPAIVYFNQCDQCGTWFVTTSPRRFCGKCATWECNTQKPDSLTEG